MVRVCIIKHPLYSSFPDADWSTFEAPRERVPLVTEENVYANVI